ncbi:MAG: MMPL family transporter [Desulfobacteraceae bacterium]|nr:MMPL family transporter [Desulfobacteraceae bacterium]
MHSKVFKNKYEKIMINYRKIVNLLLSNRLVILAIVFLITVSLGWQLEGIKISRDLRVGLSDDDPEIKLLTQFREKFGEAELMVVVIESDNIFLQKNIAYIRKLTNEISKIQSVKNVISITNAIDFSYKDGELIAKPFLPDILYTEEDLEKKREIALLNSDWVKSFISADGKISTINMLLSDESHDVEERFKAVTSVREILNNNTYEEGRVFLTGLSPIADDTKKLIIGDLLKFLWLTPLVMLFLMLPVFRSVSVVMIPVVIIGISLTWLFGVFFWAGGEISITSVMLPTLISVVCLSDIIHIITYFFGQTSLNIGRKEAILVTMEEMIPVCFLTSITTAAGFGALAFSDLESVCQFGLLAATGIMAAYFLSILLIPIGLSLVPMPKSSKVDLKLHSLTTILLKNISQFIKKDRFLIGLLTILISLFSIIGLFQLKAETHISHYLPESSPSIKGMNIIQDKLSGFSTLEIFCKGIPGDFRKSWALKELDKIHAFLKVFPGIDKSFSIVDFIKKTDNKSADNEDEKMGILEDSGRIAEWFFYLSISDQAHLIDPFITDDYSNARVSIRIPAMGTADQLKLISKLELFMKNNLDKRIEFHVTGALKLYATQSMVLIKSMINSLSISICFIACLLIIYFRSVPMGLFSMIPNILPIIFCLGFMGWLKISLDISTIMIACIAIAIAVDDTIHFLTRYQKNTRDGQDSFTAINETITTSGRAIVYTSFVLALGFSLFVFSNFLPNRYFGIFMAFNMISALIVDLTVLPALLKRGYFVGGGR